MVGKSQPSSSDRRRPGNASANGAAQRMRSPRDSSKKQRPQRARPIEDQSPISKIVTARETPAGTEYLVRWEGFGYEHDSWLLASSRPFDTVMIKQFEAVRGRPQQIAGQQNEPGVFQEDLGRADRSIQPCMEYFPTPEQYAEPMKFIESIYDEASRFGVAVINPPATEQFNRTVSPDKFPTKLLRVAPLQRKEGDPGFEVYQEAMSCEQYKELADMFAESELGDSKSQQKLNYLDIEDHFFAALAAGDRYVRYGNDVDNTAFPGDEASPWTPAAIARLKGSFFEKVEEMIGITTPFMYIGMLYAFFSWHTEDNDLYSINYMIEGSPKTWFAIPHFGAEAYDAVFNKCAQFSDTLYKYPDLKWRKCTMLQPQLLRQAGVPVHRAIQHRGQHVVTFPRAYHGGFSHGFNYGEATNFACLNWAQFGSDAQERYRSLRRAPRATYINMDELLWQFVVEKENQDDHDADALHRVKAVLAKRVGRELYERQQMRDVGQVVQVDCSLDALEALGSTCFELKPPAIKDEPVTESDEKVRAAAQAEEAAAEQTRKRKAAEQAESARKKRLAEEATALLTKQAEEERKRKAEEEAESARKKRQAEEVMALAKAKEEEEARQKAEELAAKERQAQEESKRKAEQEEAERLQKAEEEKQRIEAKLAAEEDEKRGWVTDPSQHMWIGALVKRGSVEGEILKYLPLGEPPLWQVVYKNGMTEELGELEVNELLVNLFLKQSYPREVTSRLKASTVVPPEPKEKPPVEKPVLEPLNIEPKPLETPVEPKAPSSPVLKSKSCFHCTQSEKSCPKRIYKACVNASCPRRWCSGCFDGHEGPECPPCTKITCEGGCAKCRKALYPAQKNSGKKPAPKPRVSSGGTPKPRPAKRELPALLEDGFEEPADFVRKSRRSVQRVSYREIPESHIYSNEDTAALETMGSPRDRTERKAAIKRSAVEQYKTLSDLELRNSLCHHCQQPCFFSGVVSTCSREQIVSCLAHASGMCKCKPPFECRRLLFWESTMALEMFMESNAFNRKDRLNSLMDCTQMQSALTKPGQSRVRVNSGRALHCQCTICGVTSLPVHEVLRHPVVSRGALVIPVCGDCNPKVQDLPMKCVNSPGPVSYTHLRAHETVLDLVCRLLLEKKKKLH
eukprot:TRINITY_DN4278_c0_g1_i1.p1 TRINITY_DN4278_c0_g1~~TRINITY_DN4278_c0_g1_i1.p1  ORF type:complete len:1136 (-),score=280.05 TRINITY_DN4278_c0_g1_i1:19-3426(-)